MDISLLVNFSLPLRPDASGLASATVGRLSGGGDIVTPFGTVQVKEQARRQ